MIFLSAFLLCLLLNLTPLTLSLLCANKRIYFDKSIILLFSIITSIGIVFFMYTGKLIAKLFIPEIGNIFGGVSLSFIGVYYIVEYIKLKNKTAGYDTSYYFESSLEYKKLLETTSDIVEFNNLKAITLFSCLKFSMEFLINNILIYISAGITGINVDLCVFFYFILSLLVLDIGYFNFNENLINFFKRYFYLIGGISLIVLGLFETFVW